MNVLIGIHCVVPGCRNTFKKVNQWKATPCMKPLHKGQLHATCACPEPYRFYRFPEEVKLRKIWLERVKRTDLEVNNLTRVCSFHFVEGKPTRAYYFPDISLKRGNDEDSDTVEIKQEVDEDHEEKPPTLSIIPMEFIQENDDDEEDDHHDHRISNSVTISRVSGTRVVGAGVNRKRSQSRNDGSEECPFEIEMLSDEDEEEDVEESDDDDEFSDEIEMIECTPLTGVKTVATPKPQTTQSAIPISKSKSSVPRIVTTTTTTTSSAGGTIQNQKQKICLPIKSLSQMQASSGQGQQGSSSVSVQQTFQPIITKVNSTAGNNQVRVNNSATTNNVQRPNNNVSKAIVATNGTTTTPAKPVATYDLSKQQLQIANPVKYIQDCHNRIAELLAEKNKIETKNIELDAKYRQALAKNRQLEAKIKELEEMRTNSSSGQQLNTPTFNLLPSLAQGIVINGGRIVAASASTNGNNAGGPPAKRRFIQVIRQ